MKEIFAPDGAEVCELVGLLFLEKIRKDKRFKDLNFGIYRDDGLAVHGRLPGKIEDIRKGLHQLFRQHGLKILMDGKSTTRVDFLDITLDLAKDKFLPYRKPNDVPLYIHVGSNHPQRHPPSATLDRKKAQLTCQHR